MSNKQTAMQDLRNDLVEIISSSSKALEEINNETIRFACQDVVKRTLNSIIKRIDEELLEMEEQQIEDAISNANKSNNRNVSLNPEQYYNETFKKK